MHNFITISTILLLVPLKLMLIYSLIFQIRRTYVVFRFKSIIYTVLLAVTTVIVSFIIFEIVAQAYLVSTFYSLKDKLLTHINPNILKIKLILVSSLILVALISIPIISLPGNDFFGFNLKFFKHALEWDYFIGVISFYLLTFLMWKKN